MRLTALYTHCLAWQDTSCSIRTPDIASLFILSLSLLPFSPPFTGLQLAVFVPPHVTPNLSDRPLIRFFSMVDASWLGDTKMPPRFQLSSACFDATNDVIWGYVAPWSRVHKWQNSKRARTIHTHS